MCLMAKCMKYLYRSLSVTLKISSYPARENMADLEVSFEQKIVFEILPPGAVSFAAQAMVGETIYPVVESTNATFRVKDLISAPVAQFSMRVRSMSDAGVWGKWSNPIVVAVVAPRPPSSPKAID